MGRESSLHSHLRVLPELPPPTESDQCAACDEEEREEQEENQADRSQTLHQIAFRGGGPELRQVDVTERTRAETQQSVHLERKHISALYHLISLALVYLVLALRNSVPS